MQNFVCGGPLTLYQSSIKTLQTQRKKTTTTTKKKNKIQLQLRTKKVIIVKRGEKVNNTCAKRRYR